VLEQTLGHITHADNLSRLIPSDPRLHAVFGHVPYAVEGVWARLPGYSNWTVRAGLRARRVIRQMRRGGSLDALFVHTQVPAVFARSAMRRIPTVVSVDATPIQYDELGAHYGHDVGSARTEGLKWRLNRDCFARAAHLVAWSEWAKRGLVEGYSVEADRVTVLAPGVLPDVWERPADQPRDVDVVRILFVGGDLERKGGTDLIEAVRQLRASRTGRDGPAVELHLVTRADLPEEPGVFVHRGLNPNSAELVELYHRSHIFCLPTLGDCLPMVLSEAGAARLPLVSTDVGAIREIVRPDETGFLVPVHQPAELARTLGVLVDYPELRQRLGDRAHDHVRQRYDAQTNARLLVEILLAVADRLEVAR
jgi:glycosyltransferase involved in cell wall biosynthesis